MSRIEHGLSAEALFDKQVDTYTKLGFTALIGSESFDELKIRLLDTVTKHTAPDYFSIAIPDAAIPLGEQLRLAGSRAFLRGENMVNTESWDVEPTAPYVITGVDDGEEYRGIPAETAAEEITKSGRHSFRIDELVSLGLHAPQLWTPPHRGLYAAATLHPEGGQLPATIDLYRYGNGGLKVKRDPGTIGDVDWTTPSYLDRVTVV